MLSRRYMRVVVLVVHPTHPAVLVVGNGHLDHEAPHKAPLAKHTIIALAQLVIL
jgi:hypothetical protein